MKIQLKRVKKVKDSKKKIRWIQIDIATIMLLIVILLET